MTVILLAFCLFQFIVAIPNDQTQIEKYNDKIRTYQLEVPGRHPITIIETAPDKRQDKWGASSTSEKDEIEMKNLMTHIVHDVSGNQPRCYGPSCQEGFDETVGPQDNIEEFSTENTDKLKDIRDFSKDRFEAITALAAKLKKDNLKADRFSSYNNEEDEEDNGKVYTYWNRLKVKNHKHPYDDKDGWVTLEPVAWSTSKISKWKPNVKKQKPNHWNDNNDDDRFPNDDRYTSYQNMENSYTYPQKKPSGMNRPGFINNKFHVSSDYDTELPSKPTWASNNNMNKFPPSSHSYHSSWSPDESRRPHKPHCDSDENYPNEDTVYYGMSDSVITDPRPTNFPYEYEALHQSPSQKRPIRRPTQVIYAGNDYDDDRSSRPPYGDGQWVLLSTTKGYRNKKRQRSLNPPEDHLDFPTVTSHQAVALTVLPVDDSHTNMTTSHGGMLEVERSFQTVEESKRDMDKKNDLEVSASENRPVKKKVVRRKIVPHKNSPDSSTVLAAVGAGMLPATMAMVVPMMLGRRRRRRDTHEISHIDQLLYRYE